MRRDRRRRFPNSQPPRRGEPDLPALTELERFTEASLHQWLAAKANLDALQRALYFQLEPLRQRNVGRLLDALLSQTHPSLSLDGWSRIVDYRYGLEPLCAAGSLKGEGGRFNIGSELSPGTFTAFPALYIAEDYEAAFRERFASPPREHGELSAEELALRSPGSFTQVRLRGHIENLIDVGSLDALKPLRECAPGISDSPRRSAIWAKTRVAPPSGADSFAGHSSAPIASSELANASAAIRLAFQLSDIWAYCRSRRPARNPISVGSARYKALPRLVSKELDR